MTEPPDPASAIAADRLGFGGARRRSIRAALAYAPAHLLPAVLGAATTPVLTRALGPAEFGIYAVALTLLLLSTVLASEAAAGALRRLYAAQTSTDQRRRLVSSLGTLSLALALASAVVLALCAVVTGMLGESEQWRPALLATAAAAATYSVFQYALITLYVQEKTVLTSAWQSAHSIGKAAALVVGALIFGTAAGSLAAYAIVLVALAAWLTWRHPWLRSRPDAALARRGLAYGLPLVLSWIAFVALANADRLTLAAAYGAAATGRYSAAYIVAEFTVMTLITLGTFAMYPSIVTLWEAGDVDHARRLIRSATHAFLVVSTTIVAVLAVGGRGIVELVAGPDFAINSWIPAAIAVGMVMFGLSRLEGIVFELRMDTSRWARLAIAGALLGVPLSVILVVAAGLSGAAVATAASYFLLWAMVRRRAFTLGLGGVGLVPLVLLAVATGAVIAGTSAIPGLGSIIAACIAQPLVALAALRAD